MRNEYLQLYLSIIEYKEIVNLGKEPNPQLLFVEIILNHSLS